MKRLIIILGMHRSGTSVMAHLSQCMGAYLGEENELMGAASGNPDGHFENLELFRINSNVLRACGGEWYTLEELNPDYDSPQIIEAMREIKDTIQKLFEKSDTVVVKDPRISVLLPLWDKVIKELKLKVDYIWVFRNPLEVMESLRKRDGYSNKHGLLLWIHYNLSILKFLQGKEYLLINYRDVLEHSQVIEELGRFFGCELNDNLKCELNHIVKHRYCHSVYSYQDVKNTQNELLINIYGALLKNHEAETDVPELEKSYKTAIVKVENRFMDYDALENIGCIKEKEIIIYGAGDYGRRAAEMLQQLGVSKYNFCDKDIHKHGVKIMNGKVLSIAEIENQENLLVIIAIENETVRKEIEQTLMYIAGIQFLSWFALKIVWKYFVVDYTTMISRVEALSSWYGTLESRGECIKDACKCSVLVYQNGKVGSSTISASLWNIGVSNAHIHRFFFKNDIVGELILGKNQIEFIKKTNIFRAQSPEYLRQIKNEIEGKKIITLVREPISVDLSTVFQWIGSGIVDGYFAENIKQGKTFLQIVSELMVKIQNRLFNWFDEELKELCGIDIFMYPFNKEKGYTIISENGVEVLLIKVEKLSQMTEVIGDFIGNRQFELINTNVGKEKEYAHIYKEVKKNLELPWEYVEHYYKNNSCMSHFYSNEEQKRFLSKWIRCVKENA